MSIPPLVCSTPPPPEQCEEDKDPDDFGIPYNLSQNDDDEDDFGYGDYSSYSHYKSKTDAKTEEKLSHNNESASIGEIKPVNEIEIEHSVCNENDHTVGAKTTNETKFKCDEDTNIEDLGLEVSEESISSNERDVEEHREKENDSIENSTKDTVLNIISEVNVSDTPPISCEEIAVDKSSIDHYEDTLSKDTGQIENASYNFVFSENNPPSTDEVSKNDLSDNEAKEPVQETNLEDDFGDFDDFQFASLECQPSAVIEKCDNPWGSNETDNDDCFGNFTANFDERQNAPVTTENVHGRDQKDTQNYESSPKDEDDDFGDFDDFKSSSVENFSREVIEEPESSQHMHVLNFQTSDNEIQVMESITKVLSSIFEDEIAEPDCEFEGKLETRLSETWRHLRETDVRQPYIINWNNSLGQKTLLRALCIDSRNILFGPKWGYSMPKYAVNLSAAPLQPQKPLTPSNTSQSEATPSDKPSAKPSGWTDPFTADGQEFTYAEALLLDLEHLMATLDQMAHNHSTLKISELLSNACNTENESVEVTPTDLDVFEAAMTTKPDKIYSSTLNVQPLRQISLPDTHIFTPTDSETPRSKTIHYDSGPPVLLPQPVLESSKQSEPSHTQLSTSIEDNLDDDYWEFQDFKSKPESATTVPPQELTSDAKSEKVLKPNVTYESQVLQPIKMEPLMPTVNWPDPGEIKEVFDGFSDFVSNSSWTNDKSQVSTPEVQDSPIGEKDILDKINDKHKNVESKECPTPNSKDDFDDDFNTFQSALPPRRNTTDSSSLGGTLFNNIPSQNTSRIDFDHAFPKNSNIKSDIISVNNPIRPNEALTPNIGFISNKTELTSNKSSISLGNQMPNLLQPMPATSKLPVSQAKQKTGQILQPLSLESYSQINWPNPGIDLQDLSRFNPVETLHSLKSDLSVGGPSKGSTPVHSQKATVNNQVPDDDIWGEFVSSKPKQVTVPKKAPMFSDDDEWTDFVSSPSVKPQNGLNTISLNVHTNSNTQKSNNLNKFPMKNNQIPLDIPTLNYITPKTTTGHHSYNDRHFQNL